MVEQMLKPVQTILRIEDFIIFNKNCFIERQKKDNQTDCEIKEKIWLNLNLH